MPTKREESIGGTIPTLTKILSEREKDLDAREEKLREDRERLDEREKELTASEENLEQDWERLEVEKSAYYGETSPSDVLRLNIGGTKTAVLRSTLTSVPGSMLASKFSGRWDDSIQKDKDGDFYIDHDFHVFDLMLSYLRNMAIGDSIYPIHPPTPKEAGQDMDVAFYRMVEYYGMTDILYPTKLAIDIGRSEDVTIDGFKKAYAKSWAGFRLALYGHTRRVRTYEVKLGSVERVAIHWSLSSETKSDRGDVIRFSLVLTRSKQPCTYVIYWSLEKNGENLIRYEVPFEISHWGGDSPQDLKGTVVRSKDYGKFWYINGELIEPPIDMKESLGLFSDRNPLSHLSPYICVEGDFEVTKVELDI